MHERLERQMLEARLELATDSLRARRAELGGAEERVKAARDQRAEVESRLQTVVDRRARAERALTERAERHDALARRLYDARSARERVGLRDEQVGTSAQVLARRIKRLELELEALSEAPAAAGLGGASAPAGQAGHGDESQTPNQGSAPGALQPSAPSAPMVERFWSQAWEEIRKVIMDGVERVLAHPDERGRSIAASEVAGEAERVARAAVQRALAEARPSGETLGGGRDAAEQAGDGSVRSLRTERLRAQHVADVAVAPLAERLGTALKSAAKAVEARMEQFERELGKDRGAGEEVAGELRACAGEEAEIQTRLRAVGDLVTEAEVAAQRLRDQARESELERKGLAERLGLALSEAGETADSRDRSGASPVERAVGSATVDGGGLDEEQVRVLLARVERLARRREQLGPVNPTGAGGVRGGGGSRGGDGGAARDLETALRELRAVIRDTDRQIQETFEETFDAAARNFEELVGDVFPGGSGRLRLVSDEQAPRPVLGGQPLPNSRSGARPAEQVVGGIAVEGGGHGRDLEAAEAAAEAEAELEGREEDRSGADGREGWVSASPVDGDDQGVEIEITPAGKSMKRLSLLSGGEKSMTALAFLFAVFLARPCPFYVLDEVEAALDDLNLDRFLALLRRYSDRAQFIVITHQKRTMEAADWLYGVSMGGDGVSKVLSRRLPQDRRWPPTWPRSPNPGRCYRRPARGARLERSVHRR